MKKKILYFHSGKSSFVLKDIEILERNYVVKEFYFDTRKKSRYLLEVIHQLFFLITQLHKSKLIVCQFASHCSFLPILFSKFFFKKSVIIAGGTDCVSFPSIAYGNFNNKLLSFTTSFSFKNCDLILPVHQTLVEYNYTYQPNDYPKQGYKYFIKNIKTKFKVIPNGYDASKWFCNSQKEQKSFITIGAGLGSRFGFTLKGIDLIFDIAPKFPDAIFYIIGGTAIKKEVPTNIKLLDNIPNHQIQPFLSRMQFYLQLSMSEGFPNALSEAMLCECVPIVSHVGGMPDIVKDCGYILNTKNLNELEQLIKSALNNNQLKPLGIKARERIVSNYTFENRSSMLLNEIEMLLKDNS